MTERKNYDTQFHARETCRKTDRQKESIKRQGKTQQIDKHKVTKKYKQR